MTTITGSSNNSVSRSSHPIADLPPSPSADEMHLALSRIVLRREYRPPSPPRESYVHSSEKHLELLNLLSLLLVTRAKGDVAAVMFRVLSKDNLELHYAKNRPCTDDEKTYINNIFAIVRDTSNEVHTTCWKLLALVSSKCRRKILSRATKISEQLGKLSVGSPYTIHDDSCTIAAETSVRNAIGSFFFPSDITMADFVQGWLAYLQQKPDALFVHGHEASIYQMLHIAYCIGHAPDIAQILEPKLLGRVRKLGDYYGAALALISNAASIPTEQLQSLKIVQVDTTTPRVVSLPVDFVGTINAWARHTGEPEVSERALRVAFPDMDPLPTNLLAMQNVTVSVHCECTLLLSMIDSTNGSAPVPTLLELGVSKSSCFMCREFISAVQSRYRFITVRVSSCHGKHVAGWTIPESTPSALRNIMSKRLRDEMDEVLQRATRNRKSDSIPRGSGPKEGAIVPSEAQISKALNESGVGLFSIGRK